MKDIFIDNNIAKNFATPLDPHYKELIKWLNDFDEGLVKRKPNKIFDFAHLVVSQKLLTEYLRTSRNCAKLNAMPALIGRLQREGRLQKKTKEEINNFTKEFFSKRIVRQLLSNKEDHCHIVCVLLSKRKICLTNDTNLNRDLRIFRKHNVTVSDRPESLNYR